MRRRPAALSDPVLLIDELRRMRVSFARRRLRVPAVSNQQRTPPTVYFLTPDYQSPSGGVRLVYRHVDILNAAGLPARVVHQKPGFRCEWFDSTTLVADVADVTLGPADLLVIGELDVDILAGQNPSIRHAVLNQSGSLTWQTQPALVTRHYRSPWSPAAMVTVSEHLVEFLRFSFPDVEVHRIRPSISEIFTPALVPAPKRITYMARRGAEDIRTALQMVQSARSLEGWEICPLEGLKHTEVATELRSSSLFLTGSLQEGFGLPSAEAMACANYVVGYDGGGGREFFDATFSSPVPAGDLLGLAKAIANAVEAEETVPGWLRERGTRASAFIRSTYSAQAEADDVLSTYDRLLHA